MKICVKLKINFYDLMNDIGNYISLCQLTLPCTVFVQDGFACWRECIYEIGWEWTTTDCEVDTDCDDPYSMESQGNGCNID